MRVIPDIEILTGLRLEAVNPKSSSFEPVFVSMMLAGLRSRWYSCLPMRLVECVGDLDRCLQRRSSGSAPSSRRAASVWPSRYGMTR